MRTNDGRRRRTSSQGIRQRLHDLSKVLLVLKRSPSRDNLACRTEIGSVGLDFRGGEVVGGSYQKGHGARIKWLEIRHVSRRSMGQRGGTVRLTLSLGSIVLLDGCRSSLHLGFSKRGRSDGEDLDGLGRLDVSDDVAGVCR